SHYAHLVPPLLSSCSHSLSLSFFFKHPPTPELYPLSLHDALPISPRRRQRRGPEPRQPAARDARAARSLGRAGMQRRPRRVAWRSEEHTSELQSLAYLVCRLLLEKKKKIEVTRR